MQLHQLWGQQPHGMKIPQGEGRKSGLGMATTFLYSVQKGTWSLPTCPVLSLAVSRCPCNIFVSALKHCFSFVSHCTSSGWHVLPSCPTYVTCERNSTKLQFLWCPSCSFLLLKVLHYPSSCHAFHLQSSPGTHHCQPHTRDIYVCHLCSLFYSKSLKSRIVQDLLTPPNGHKVQAWPRIQQGARTFFWSSAWVQGPKDFGNLLLLSWVRWQKAGLEME